MSDFFSVDVENLIKTAPNVRAYSDQLNGVISRLQERLGALGECWGADPMGKAFANQYITPRDQLIGGLKGAVEVLGSTADGLETMGKGFAQTEAQNVQNARSIGRNPIDTYSASTPKAPAPNRGTRR